MTDDLAIRLTRAFAMTTAAAIRSAGMQAENQDAAFRGEPPRYFAKDFIELCEVYGLEWNAIVGATTP